MLGVRVACAFLILHDASCHLLPSPDEKEQLPCGLWADSTKTQTAMEEWNIANVKSALETGALKSVVPEQAI